MNTEISGTDDTCRTIELSLDLGKPVINLIMIGLMAAVIVFLVVCVQSAYASSPDAPAFGGMRKYYLTNGSYGGANTLYTCDTGYHMASLWEILDTTQLEYNSVLGYDQADSGSGPPTNVYGWVRTGYFSNNSSTPGMGNCTVWSLTTGYGTVARLTSIWTASPDLHVWDVGSSLCNGVQRIWCVED
jgi:hypothetical protein